MLISFFLETHSLKKGTDLFAGICQMWLKGCLFVEMHEHTSLPIPDIEDICSKSVSYELSFFVGNIIDVNHRTGCFSHNPRNQYRRGGIGYAE